MRTREERDEATVGIGLAVVAAGAAGLVGTGVLAALDPLLGIHATTAAGWSVVVVALLAGAVTGTASRRAVERAPGRSLDRTRR